MWPTTHSRTRSVDMTYCGDVQGAAGAEDQPAGRARCAACTSAAAAPCCPGPPASASTSLLPPCSRSSSLHPQLFASICSSLACPSGAMRCCLYALLKSQTTVGPDNCDVGWSTVLICASSLRTSHFKLLQVHLVERIPFFDALYFVTTTLTTVGYGDVVAVSPAREGCGAGHDPCGRGPHPGADLPAVLTAYSAPAHPRCACCQNCLHWILIMMLLVAGVLGVACRS